MKKKIRILAVSKPTTFGPGVGYSHHAQALNHPDFELVDLTQDIWDDPNGFSKFDFVWAYVRFQPIILARAKEAGIPFIGGPNVVMERADKGITDDWERWYLEESGADVNLNVADYYTNHVKQFAKGIKRCETLEYCYELPMIQPVNKSRDIDVLVYVKDRVNDGKSFKMATMFCEKLEHVGLTYKIINYGSYENEDYLRACSNAKVTAWFCIEDYCSLAQMEAQNLGSCVIGTPYNLTIPVADEAICKNSQVMNEWIEWKDEKTVVSDYYNTMNAILRELNLNERVQHQSSTRFSHAEYRKNVHTLLDKIRGQDDG